MPEHLLLYAFRYALGRRTFAPHDVAEAIRDQLPLRDAGVRKAILREIELADSRNALGQPGVDDVMWRAVAADIRAAEAREQTPG